MTTAKAGTVHWTEGDEERHALWLSESGAEPPRRIAVVDDTMRASDAYGLAAQGTSLLWRGDFHNARQLLTAMARRLDRRPARRHRSLAAQPPAEAFHRYRQGQAQRARTLSALLVPLEAGYDIRLPRAPDARAACAEAFGPSAGAALVPLRTLLGAIGAHQWRVRGIEVPAAGGRIHPHYGVFAPVRAEYVDLVAGEPLPVAPTGEGTAFDVGTGTGVLAAVLVRRGVRRVVATDTDARALACARENFGRLGISGQVELVEADLFPPGRAQLVLCNPPWLPARPSTPIERGIYDPDSRMLRGFLRGLAAHLAEGGEGWLVLSDLAEHLGLRTREELLEWIRAAGLSVAGRSEVRPVHRRTADARDPLHRARAAEVTSLWRLRASA
ncbi:MAG: class I SAM-dependent methyltransferase [Proteobacteria bacterium]|nr:class I SAM-dependent methyltransferase [Pseudomonadota bacterium]